MSNITTDINNEVQAILNCISELQKKPGTDQRRLALAKTNIEQGFLWLESAINK